MDSRRAGIADEAVKGFTEGVAWEPGLADGWELGSRSGQGEEGCKGREGGLHPAWLGRKLGCSCLCVRRRGLDGTGIFA